MGKVKEFLDFAFAAFVKSDEDTDSISNRLIRVGSLASLGSVFIPTGNGSYMSVETFFTGTWKPLSWALFVVLLFWGAFEKFIFEKAKREESDAKIKELITPKLSIVYKNEEDRFLQARLLSSQKDGIGYQNRMYRLGVRNHSSVTVRKVRLLLKSISVPAHIGLVSGEHFSVQGPDRKVETDAHPSNEPTVFFNLVSHDLDGFGMQPNDLHLEYCAGHIGPSLATGMPVRYGFTVQLLGEDCPSVEAIFLLEQDSSHSTESDVLRYAARLTRINSDGSLYQESNGLVESERTK